MPPPAWRSCESSCLSAFFFPFFFLFFLIFTSFFLLIYFLTPVFHLSSFLPFFSVTVSLPPFLSTPVPFPPSSLLSCQHGAVHGVDELCRLQTCRRASLLRCAPHCHQPPPPSFWQQWSGNSSGERGRNCCVSPAPLALKDLNQCMVASWDGGGIGHCLRAKSIRHLEGITQDLNLRLSLV